MAKSGSVVPNDWLRGDGRWRAFPGAFGGGTGPRDRDHRRSELGRGGEAMTLGVGGCLNHYEIIAPVGRGGMGEVWLSRDTRLNHAVALELQPDWFAEGADLQLLREARKERPLSLLASAP